MALSRKELWKIYDNKKFPIKLVCRHNNKCEYTEMLLAVHKSMAIHTYIQYYTHRPYYLEVTGQAGCKQQVSCKN